MKKIKLFLLMTAIPFCFAMSCDNDEKEIIQNAAGSWSLVNVSGSIAGVSHDFEEGTIIWQFSMENNSITVTNTNDDESKEDFFATGSYDYHLENYNEGQPCTEGLFVDDMELGCMSVTGNQMVISQPFADGYQLTFSKTE